VSGSFKFRQLRTSMFLFLVERFYVLRWTGMRVFVKSFGCSSSYADGEVLAGCLDQAGFQLVGSVQAADVVVYNTCAVKGPTENRMIDLLKKVPKSKKLVVAGCLPLINFERLCGEVRFDGIAGPAIGEGIVAIVRSVSNGKKVVATADALRTKPSLRLPRQRLNPVTSVVPVSYGCLGSCTYCSVVFARGRLRSCAVQEIVDRVKEDLAGGAREFWVTSQDTACYGRDQNTNLAELLRALSDIEGDFRVRVGMMTPNMANNILDDLIRAFQSGKIFKFLHLPVQSGDDQILQHMRRFYSVEDFKRIITAFKKNFSEFTLATDVICGFPGESEEAFWRTVRLIEEVKPDVVNVSKFFARPRTAAAEMQEDFVPHPEIKRRSAILAKRAKEIALEKNRGWIGCTEEIFVDEVGKLSGSWVGRNVAYKPVSVKSIDNLLAKTLTVNIVKASSTHLEGEVV
jgi:threonylcarbamoyladenosine tRNA methylthiotransferase CDKAL1